MPYSFVVGVGPPVREILIAAFLGHMDRLGFACMRVAKGGDLGTMEFQRENDLMGVSILSEAHN